MKKDEDIIGKGNECEYCNEVFDDKKGWYEHIVLSGGDCTMQMHKLLWKSMIPKTRIAVINDCLEENLLTYQYDWAIKNLIIPNAEQQFEYDKEKGRFRRIK